MKLLLTALSLLAVGQGAFGKDHEMRELRLTKPPLNSTCPLSNQMLFPTQAFFKQNEGGFIKLTITNPLDVAIPITSVTYSVAGSINVGLSPPNTPAINYTRDGGMFLYPPGESVPGINNKYTRVARSSPGVPVPVISADRRRATWSNFQIAPRQKLVLVTQVRYGPGIRRSTNIVATATYPFDGRTCASTSNSFGLQSYITPVTQLQSVYNGKTITYQQYASTYKNCRAVIDTLNNTTPEACANYCNQLPTCQSFTYVRPVAGQPGTWGQMNCLFYEGNPGSSNTMNFDNANSTNAARYGGTIFLQSKNVERYIAGASCPAAQGI